MNFPLAFIGGMGYPEMLVVAFIALLLFGKRLPEVARSLGKGVTEFKKGVRGIEEEIRETTTTQYNELPHSTEAQAPQTPKFEPPTSPPNDASSASNGDLAKPADDQPKPEDRPAD
jgi:sec-independent protein translocase protein TatA